MTPDPPPADDEALVVVTNTPDPANARPHQIAGLSVETMTATDGRFVVGTWSITRLTFPGAEAVELHPPLALDYLCVHPTRPDQRVQLACSLVEELTQLLDPDATLAAADIDHTIRVLAISTVPGDQPLTDQIEAWGLDGLRRVRQLRTHRTPPSVPGRQREVARTDVVDIRHDMPAQRPGRRRRSFNELWARHGLQSIGHPYPSEEIASLLTAAFDGNTPAQLLLSRLTLRSSLAAALVAARDMNAATWTELDLDALTQQLLDAGRRTVRSWVGDPDCTHIRTWPETPPPPAGRDDPDNPTTGRGRRAPSPEPS